MAISQSLLLEAAKRVSAPTLEDCAPPVSKLAKKMREKFPRSRLVVARDRSVHVLFDHADLPDHNGFKAFLAQSGFKHTVSKGEINSYNGGAMVYGESPDYVHVAFSPDTASALISDIQPLDEGN